MNEGLRLVDSDMHVMEPPDLGDRYLDPTFKHRVSAPVGTDERRAARLGRLDRERRDDGGDSWRTLWRESGEVSSILWGRRS